MTINIFDVSIYKKYNIDLSNLSDDDALKHFMQYQNEPRIYGATNSTSEALSMRWLRGYGIEFGAGAFPTMLYGSATTIKVDSDPDLLFHGDKVEELLSIDLSDLSHLENHFAFSIASHVLEHTDSFLRAFENLILITKNGGYIYIVLPDIRFLHDIEWMQTFSFFHHEEEYVQPLIHSKEHDLNVINSQKNKLDQTVNMHASIPDEFVKGLIAGEIPAEYRFLCHKHNYNFEDWTSLILQAKIFFNNRFSIEDIRYGHERQDCHYVLKVNK